MVLVDVGGIVFSLIELIALSDIFGRYWWLLLVCGLIASGWVLDFAQ